MLNVGEVLKRLRQETGLQQTQVAGWLTKHYKPVKKTTVSNWERGVALPNAEQFLYLCELFRVRDVQSTFLKMERRLNDAGEARLREYEDLLAESARYRHSPARAQVRMLPLYNQPVSAGTGQFLDGDDYEMVEVDGNVPLSADFGVPISGDSMAPYYVDGQVVWVQRRERVEPGEVGIFYHDGQSFLKKLEQDERGLYLVSYNKKYAPIDVTRAEDLRAFGKVVS